jgi:glutaredoxin
MKRILLTLLLLLVGCGPSYDTFATCLTEKGVTMYGAFWCPHCVRQKEAFGSSFDLINYVECSLPDKSGQTQVCIDAKVESYPTWEFADGSRLTGEQPLDRLGQKAGCEVTEE